MKPAPAILCFGEVLLRLSSPGKELLLQSPRFDAHIGGAETNVAVSLRKFGHRTRMVSALPDSTLGHVCADELRRHGVDVESIAYRDGRMGMYFLTHGAGLRPAEVLYDRANSAFAAAPAGTDGEHGLAGVLGRLQQTLVAHEAEVHRQRLAVESMRVRGSRIGLLSDFVASRLEGLPEGSLREADLDNLLVVERVFGPLGAAVNATRYIALATRPGLRERSDRVDSAEEALDDTVAVDDPRVAQVAAERHAFELALQAVFEEPGAAEADDAMFDAWDALHPEGVGEAAARPSTSAFETMGKMPYDWSPARLRCIELAQELAADSA